MGDRISPALGQASWGSAACEAPGGGRGSRATAAGQGLVSPPVGPPAPASGSAIRSDAHNRPKKQDTGFDAVEGMGDRFVGAHRWRKERLRNP